MTERFDLAIVGSGFGGALLAAIARRIGLTVLLLEKGSHPRFAIGESTSPLANILLETLARRYALPEVAALARWGTWQRRHPELAGGVKRGFTFYGHRPGRPLRATAEHAEQLLVAASSNADIADTHWYRADVDAFLVGQAREAGARYVDRAALEPPSFGPEGVRLSGAAGGRRVAFEARLLVDASGPRGYLHGTGHVSESTLPDMDATHALYSHFRGVGRVEDLGVNGGETPPYPVDEAALHHVFPGGWIWVLRFNNGVASAGAALTPELAREIGAGEGEAAWHRLIARFPTIARQFDGSAAILPFAHRAPLPFRAARAAGPGWILLPSAAAFVDPLLSTGFPLTLLGVERIARAIETAWGTGDLGLRLESIAAETLAEADRTARLIGALWRCMDDFETFSAMTMFYFAAASFAEASRRLRPEENSRFLAGDDPDFQGALCRAGDRLRAASRPPRGWSDDIRTSITPRNIAGLLEPARRNWYPVDADDLRAGAGRLGATGAQIEEMLVASGLVRARSPD